jgi:hypothetical protein
MDLIRSCYQVPMRLGEGDDPTLVRWFRCSADALVFPGEHCFGSMDWDEGEACILGEQRPPRGVWDSGIRPARLNGTGHFVGTLEEFAQGGAKKFRQQNVTIIREPSLPVCGKLIEAETDGQTDPQYFHEPDCGGIRWAAEAPSGNPVDLEAFVNCTIHTAPTCPFLDGLIVELVWVPAESAYIGFATINVVDDFQVTLRVFPFGLTSVHMDFLGYGKTDGFENAFNPFSTGPFHWDHLTWIPDSGTDCSEDSQWDGDVF